MPQSFKDIDRVQGVLAFDQGDLDRAASLLENALDLTIEAHGVDHPDVARVCIDLARVYRAQDGEAAAREQLHRALRIREKLLGSNHSSVEQLRSELE